MKKCSRNIARLWNSRQIDEMFANHVVIRSQFVQIADSRID